MLIRRAEPGEIDACARLYERVLRETFTWAPPSGRAAADFRAAATLEEVYAVSYTHLTLPTKRIV